ncbi:troponin I, fast skeletal muscle-like [Lycodopsis pacificus]
MAEKKMSSGRRNQLKTLLLQIGEAMLEEEVREAEQQKIKHMEESYSLSLSLSLSNYKNQDFCRKLHKQIDLVDEERYDMEVKVTKTNKEIDDLKLKVQDLKGKFKKPALKRVRMSADAMLAALLGSKHKVSMDLRANLKQVKKEVKDEEKPTGDWRKSIEDRAGMDGRKKMFETEA